jgi:hypothetical protein
LPTTNSTIYLLVVALPANCGLLASAVLDEETVLLQLPSGGGVESGIALR